MVASSGARAVLVVLFALGGCAAPESRVLKPCPDPRPEVCTRDYRPVCGYAEGRATGKTYGNACDACADPAVEGWVAGVCPE